MTDERQCIRDGCDKPWRSRRLCKRHYGQALRSGDLPPLVQKGLEMTDEERFFCRVIEAESGCWLWTGGVSDTGYGSFKPRDGSASNAHRWSYQLLIGKVPEGLVIDHLCRTRACVNPWHMDPVTDRVNMQRGTARDERRKAAAALTHCPHGHEKTEANVYRTFNPKRNRWESKCRPCRNKRVAAHRAKYGRKY